MATTGDLTVHDGVMKIVGGKLTKQYEETTILYNRISKGKGTKISDRGVEIPTHLTGNYAYTFTSDGGDLPAGGSNFVKRAQVFFKNMAFSCRLTGAAIDAINSKDVAYVTDVLQFELDETMKSGYKQLNVHSWGKGDGRLATISTGASSATQTVSNNDANRYLKDGLMVDAVTTSTDTVSVTGATISNSKASSTTFTTSASISTTTNDIIVPSGGYNRAIMGIKGMVDDTTDGETVFQSISRNTYTGYRSFRVNASSTGLDVSFLRRLLSAGIHISAGELNRERLEFWSHPAQTSAYSSLGWSLKRADMKNKSIDLGYTTYEYEGINWVEDVDAPKDEVYALDWSTFKKYVAKDMGWDDKTGAILRQVPSTTSGIAYTDQYEAYLTARFNFGCDQPNRNGWIDNLSVPTGF